MKERVRVPDERFGAAPERCAATDEARALSGERVRASEEGVRATTEANGASEDRDRPLLGQALRLALGDRCRCEVPEDTSLLWDACAPPDGLRPEA